MREERQLKKKIAAIGDKKVLLPVYRWVSGC